MKIIGVTGGIGSGKSTVSKLLQESGGFVIDADKIARSIVNKGQPAYPEIIEAFGQSILDQDGELDRRILASLVFKDNEKLEILNSITHKYVAGEIVRQIEESSMDGFNFAVVDAPLPIKHGFIDVAHQIWVVVASLETRINRVMERSNMTYNEVYERINMQMSENEYLKIAHKVLKNDGDFEELKNLVTNLLREFLDKVV